MQSVDGVLIVSRCHDRKSSRDIELRVRLRGSGEPRVRHSDPKLCAASKLSRKLLRFRSLRLSCRSLHVSCRSLHVSCRTKLTRKLPLKRGLAHTPSGDHAGLSCPGCGATTRSSRPERRTAHRPPCLLHTTGRALAADFATSCPPPRATAFLADASLPPLSHEWRVCLWQAAT